MCTPLTCTMNMFLSVCFILCLSRINALDTVDGLLSRPVAGCENDRVVECTAAILNLGFVGMSIYDVRDPLESIVTFKEKTQECKISIATLASCNVTASAVTLQVVLTDLTEGEVRSYRCEVNYFKTEAWMDTFVINVTLPSKETKPVSLRPTTATNGGADGSTEVSASSQPAEKPEGATTMESDQSEAVSTGQTFNTVSVATGAGVTFVFMATIMTLLVLRLKRGSFCACIRRSSITKRGEQSKVEESELAERHQGHVEIPREPATDEYRDASSSTYITPVYKWRQPAGPPERHVFRRVEESDSSSPYEEVP